MHFLPVEPQWDAGIWRARAREALRAGWPPESVRWEGATQAGLAFASSGEVADGPAAPAGLRVPRDFIALAEAVACHQDPQRHALLYRVLWRMAHGEPRLIERATDVDVHRLRELEKAVRRDCHKMKAFVRFRALAGEPERFVAWFEPAHWILDRVAPFFARRFAGMRWAILTPYRSVCWDDGQLHFGEGSTRAAAPADDEHESLWRTYYANIFNPARINPRMMRQEMPQKYWKLLPEAQLLPLLIRDAGPRMQEMADRAPMPVRRRLPDRPRDAAAPAPATLDAMAQDLAACRRCPLWEPATQAVRGEGPSTARIMLVGEQPGDAEDLTGRPFVGPAGQLLDDVLRGLGLDRRAMFVTNAVKHFRFEQRGKRRLHRNPERAHVHACGPWLQRELALVQPRVVVALGGTAALALFGPDFRLAAQRGQWQRMESGVRAFATYHPSAVLRQPPRQRDAWRQMLAADLALLQGEPLPAPATAVP
ncbi:DNA polymerase [Stenotrophomonas panacihumi]|uniref:Type-4 uracil-DNA glycosylase n=1 Tax=Stenotrophomonas panacihumi TaxID=676599 RepID=A0A0R0AFK5_9GAMM|nr:UdgX family uracil-DNA binding protein [Stenotrophomonas panacihumi]KRG43647.1 DNA polymerase [Stenotrophomonas panacihumi]PTN55393.1 uracil-DNA glycosylase [Stenotrophomonas panacihumi]